MSAPSPKRNPFFPLCAALSALFVITILAQLASIISDPRAPVARWLERHAGTLFVVEVIAILLSGLIALIIDRQQSLAAAREAASVIRDESSNRAPPNAALRNSPP